MLLSVFWSSQKYVLKKREIVDLEKQAEVGLRDTEVSLPLFTVDSN